MGVSKYYYKFKNYVRRARKFGLRKDIFLASDVQFLGLDSVKIGSFTTIGQGTLFTINNREIAGDKLTIGNNVYIGRDNFFTVGKRIVINDYCMFGNNCSFLGSDHNFNNPLMPYATTGASSEKEIYIGANCWMGLSASVVGDIKIGHGSIIGANSVVTKDIPPFSIAVGNPAKVIKRFNFVTSSWEKGQTESSYIDEEQYLEILRKNKNQLPLQYYGSSKEFGDL